MAQFVIYQQANREIAIVCPTGHYPIAETAKKDVPAGVPYLIVNDTDLPSEFEYSAAWEADFSQPHGTGLGHDAWVATGWKDASEFDLETHNANAASDMMAQLQTAAEQENAQFDALQKPIAGGANGS